MKNWYCVILLLLVISCEKQDPEPYDETTHDDIDIVNTDIYETMKDIYLWYDHLPNIDPTIFETPYDLMETLRYDKDKYSYVVSQSEFLRYYVEGKSTGHGFGLSAGNNNELFVAYVYKNTPAYNAGVKRGWKIESVNETPTNSNNYVDAIGPADSTTFNTFTFRLPSDSVVTRVIEKKEIDINPVLLDTIYDYGSEKIGYLVFQEFIDVADEYLDEAFKKFNHRKINYLVIDLRYNGGGLGHVVNYMANLIAGADYPGSTFYRTTHNNKNADKNKLVNFETLPYSLSSLQGLYFICTSSSASASELIMNGLSTYYTTTFIGSATFGKPVGMYAYNFRYYDYTFAPVSYSIENSEGFSDYFNGLPADYKVEDNLNYDFGDIHEPNLNKALELIGVSVPDSNTSLKSSPGSFQYIPRKKAFNNLFMNNFEQ